MSEQNHLELGRVILDFPIQAYTIKSLHVHEEANAHGSLTLLFIAKGPVSKQDCIRYADSPIRILDDQGNIVGVMDGNHNRTRYHLNDGSASAPCSPWPATTAATAHPDVFKRLSTDFAEK